MSEPLEDDARPAQSPRTSWTKRKKVLAGLGATGCLVLGTLALPQLGEWNERLYCRSVYRQIGGQHQRGLAYERETGGRTYVPAVPEKALFDRECLNDQKHRREGFMGLFHSDHTEWRPVNGEAAR
jgi:hypothetical protein